MKTYSKISPSLLFFLLMLSSNLYSDNSISNMNSKLKKIDSQIKQKNARIKVIDSTTLKLSDQIAKLEREMKEDEKEKRRILEEIEITKKNIDYGEKNLNITHDAGYQKQMEYTAKIIAWDRYAKIYGSTLPEKEVLGKHYREMLNYDLKRMDYITNVEGNIIEVKNEIEKQKIKLDSLQKALVLNIQNSEKKKKEHSKLIEKLKIEKKDHVQNIEKLKQEKIRISKEIERIIREAAKKQKAQNQKNNQTPSISSAEAYKKLGKTSVPLAGKIVVAFQQMKNKVVPSNGIEIEGRVGSIIRASKGGTVIYSDKFQGLGKVVMIDYGNSIIGVYGNLISTKVKLNEKVKEGQSIGSLGLSSENKACLYYELRANLKAIDPVPSFKWGCYEKVLYFL